MAQSVVPTFAAVTTAYYAANTNSVVYNTVPPPFSSYTPTPTATATNTPTNTPTSTPTFTATNTPTITPTPTNTPISAGTVVLVAPSTTVTPVIVTSAAFTSALGVNLSVIAAPAASVSMAVPCFSLGSGSATFSASKPETVYWHVSN